MLLVFVNPSAVKTVTDNAGPVLAPLLVLSVGACIYVVYRYIIGEWILYRVTHWVDSITAKDSAGRDLSPIRHLRKLGVPRRESRAAYNALRHEFLDDKVKKQLDFAHAEIHVLYITCIELISLSIFLAATGMKKQYPLILIVGLVVLCGAMATDIQQHRSEVRTIRSNKAEAEVRDFLRAKGFL